MEDRVYAFDDEKIHEGNRGLAINHDEVEAATSALLDQMTLQQMFNEIRGSQAQTIAGLYYAGGDDSLGIPSYRMVDGPRGARAGNATAFPVAMARAATFNVMLERNVGKAIGLEVAAKGGNVLLAPTINLLRHPGWGRAQETYSEDTWHTGAMGAAFISGAQNHVLASPKHFAANNVEFTRFEMSADMPDRVLHEVYLPHFKRCVQEAGAASVMSAYNRLNNTYCGEHPTLLTDILRGQWGFRGFVESDWFLGTRSCAPALNAGLDIEMPAAYRFSDDNLMKAIEAGELSEDTVRIAAGRALYMKIAWNLANPEPVDENVVESEAHLSLAREVSEQSIVLLKNEASLLPLAPGTKVALVGDLADTINLGDRGSSYVNSTEVITPLKGLKATQQGANVTWFASDADMSALAEFDVTVVIAGLTYREEGEFIPTQQQEAEGDTLARGGDRASLALPDHQLELIRTAAANSRKTVVALEAGSAVEVADWLGNIDALLMLWYPGCQGGHALANVLFGDANPSGKLPVTFAASMDQLVPWDIESLNVAHELLPGYKHLDANGHEPTFPFGFGLSYTSFSIDNLFVERFDNGFEVSVDITNTGDRAGAEVAQLYLSYEESEVERPVRELKGFGRLALEPGESGTLVFEVMDEDLEYYDEGFGDWLLEPCTYHFHVGNSSRHLPLQQPWRFDGTEFEPI